MFDNYFGISPILNSYNNTIQDCQIFNNSYGVEFATAGENNTVINCEIKNNPWRGIDVANTNHLDIIDCEIGFKGVSLNHGIDIDYSTYINITVVSIAIILLSYIIWHEKLNIRQVAGVITAITATILISINI